MALETSLLGAAGEYFVMSELLRLGRIAALAPRGSPRADIVVSDMSFNHLCSIQVKTRSQSGGDGGWHMSEKHETMVSDNLFYAFVDFSAGGPSIHHVYIVPSATVAAVLTYTHQQWLNSEGKGGRKRNDSKIRRFLPSYTRIVGHEDHPYTDGWIKGFRDNWDILDIPTIAPTDASA